MSDKTTYYIVVNNKDGGLSSWDTSSQEVAQSCQDELGAKLFSTQEEANDYIKELLNEKRTKHQ